MSSQFSQNHEVVGLDYSTVDGLHRKRLLAFVNHFLTRTIDSLTIFSRTCDAKLSSISGRIKKLENALQLLEHKLASVPELNELPTTTSSKAVESKHDVSSTTTKVLNNFCLFHRGVDGVSLRNILCDPHPDHI